MKPLACVLVAEENDIIAANFCSIFKERCQRWPVLAVNDGEHALAYLSGMTRAVRNSHNLIRPVLLLSPTIRPVSAAQILDWARRQPALQTMVIALLCDPTQRAPFSDLNEHAHLLLDRPGVASQIEALVAAIESRAPVIPMPVNPHARPQTFAESVFAGTVPAVAN